ncbi:MAG: CHAT domain-containing protein [Bacteroidales bacterium]|nr:CHAT domain-containing protein [Bacteroidales bacterium]
MRALFLILLFGAGRTIPLHSQTSPQDSIQTLLESAKNSMARGDQEESLRLIRKIHGIRKRLYPENSSEMVSSYVNLAIGHIQTWEYDSSLYYLQEAERNHKNCPDCDPLILAHLYTYMGRTYINLGDHLQAGIALKKARQIYSATSDPPVARVAALIYRIAENEWYQENYDLALSYYTQNLKYADLTGNHFLRYSILSGMADIYAKRGDLQKSIMLQESALTELKKDPDASTKSIALTYNNLGMDYIKTGELEKAKQYLEYALSIYKKTDTEGLFSKAYVLDSYGSLLLKQAKYQEALSYYQEALTVASPKFSPQDVFDNPKLEIIDDQLISITILKSKSKCFLELFSGSGDANYLSEALECDLLALEIIESLRNSKLHYESKIRIASYQYEIFNNSLDLIALSYDQLDRVDLIRKAFNVSERSKSAILLSTLRELNAKDLGGIPDSLLRKEKDLDTRLGLYKASIYEEKQKGVPDSLRLAEWESRYFEAFKQYTRLVDLFEKEFPKYHQLKYDPSVSGIADLQKHLGNEYAVLQYNLTDTALHTFCITGNSIDYCAQMVPGEFDTIVRAYLDNFHHFDFSRQSGKDFSLFCEQSHYLYQLLIEPFASKLKATHLIVVPDDVLSYLPFETLIRSMPSANGYTSYKNLDYLLLDYNISYAFSSTLYIKGIEQRPRKNVNKLLAFAPSYGLLPEEVQREKYTQRSALELNLKLNPIPGALNEAKMLKKTMKADVFSRFSATEKTFREKVAQYDIIHLAMHAILDNKNPLYSKLIFAPEPDSLHDGLLNTYEVFGLDLNARMVVLSACSTGEGEYSKGEGVLSLARGFAYAGTPSMVMTMWEVEDLSGSLLMVEFYAQLRKGKSKSEALRLAKLKYLKECLPEASHPFFWSAFSVVGNPDPLYTEEPEDSNWWILGISALFLAALAGIAWYIRKRRKLTF